MPQLILPLCMLLAFAATKGNADEVVSLKQEGTYEAPICNTSLTCNITQTDLSPTPDTSIPNTTNRPWVCIGCHDGFTEEAGFHFEIIENNSDTRSIIYSLTITKCYKEVLIISCYASVDSLKTVQLVSGLGDSEFWTNGTYEPPTCNVTLNCIVRQTGFPRIHWPYLVYPSNPPWMCTRCCDGFNEEAGFHFDVLEDSDTNITKYSLTVSKCQSESVLIGCYGGLPLSFRSTILRIRRDFDMVRLLSLCPKKDTNDIFPNKDILPTKNHKGKIAARSYNPAYSLLLIPLILLGLWEGALAIRKIRKERREQGSECGCKLSSVLCFRSRSSES